MLPLRSERRRHERLRFRGAVNLTWTGPKGDSRSVTGNCVDMSLFGMSIEVPEQIPLGSEIFLHGLNEVPQPAIVRHCRQYGPWFRVGLRFPRPVNVKQGAEQSESSLPASRR